jgi:hypothetical protein
MLRTRSNGGGRVFANTVIDIPVNIKERDLLAGQLTASQEGHAIVQAISRWLPTAAARVQTRVYSHVRFVVDKVALEQVFSPSTSVSLANLHSTKFSTITITYHLGLVQ